MNHVRRLVSWSYCVFATFGPNKEIETNTQLGNWLKHMASKCTSSVNNVSCAVRSCLSYPLITGSFVDLFLALENMSLWETLTLQILLNCSSINEPDFKKNFWVLSLLVIFSPSVFMKPYFCFYIINKIITTIKILSKVFHYLKCIRYFSLMLYM
jgi:hypothetical protein